MKNVQKNLILLCISIAATIFMSATTYAATYTVNSRDWHSDGFCDADCTFLEAVEAVNDGSGGDTIDMTSIPGAQGQILLGSSVQILKDNTTILGDPTRTDMLVGGDSVDYAIVVVSDDNVFDGVGIAGDLASNGWALKLEGDRNMIKDSHIDADFLGSDHYGSANAIYVTGSDNVIGTGAEKNMIGGEVYVASGSDNLIAGNYIGVSGNGSNISSQVSDANGIFIGDSVDSVTIGQAGEESSGRNYIGNFGSEGEGEGYGGIVLESGTNVDRTVTINNNYIGAGAGSIATPNYVGIYVNGEGTVNIGGENNGNRNIISGNLWGGVVIGNDFTGTVNIKGNCIGLGTDGDTIPDGETQDHGIDVTGGGTVNIGDTGEDRNTISGNGTGIIVEENSTATLTIKGNYIGLNDTGSIAVGNEHTGIYLSKPAHIYSNVISGNQNKGIGVEAGADGTDIYGNYIGLNAEGTGEVFGNVEDGIAVSATGVIIGDPILGGNVISGNGAGIGVRDGGSATIKANIIGKDAADVSLISNGTIFTGAFHRGGIVVNGIAVIGGNGAGEGNIISGNYGQGILVNTSGSVDIKGNTIMGNIAGADDTALFKGDGIAITDAGVLDVGDVTIGGDAAGDENVIGDNGGNGIYVLHYVAEAGGGLGIDGLSILGNYIGTNSDGDDLGNIGSSGIPGYPGNPADPIRMSGNGILVYDPDHGAITGLVIGSEAAPNYIRYNRKNGIYNIYLAGGIIDHNVISDQTDDGIINTSSSPTISNNTIANSGYSGIMNVVYYGEDLSPAGYADDILSEPAITGNTFSNNGLTGVVLEGDLWSAADIISVDSIPVNAATLLADNVFSDGDPLLSKIIQMWTAVVEVLDGSNNPVTSGVSVSFEKGFVVGNLEGNIVDALTVYSGGAWGAEGFDYENVITWAVISEYCVDRDGEIVDYNPNTITAVTPTGTYTATYNFNGQSHMETGKGLPIDRGGRYQIAEVIAVEEEEEEDRGGGGAIIFHYKTPGPSEPDDENQNDEEENKNNEGTEDLAKQIIETTDQVQVQVKIDKVTEKAASGEELTKEEKTLLEEKETVEKVKSNVKEFLSTGVETSTAEQQENYKQIFESAKEIFAGSADADGDGISNAQELKNGTDPLINNKGTIKDVFAKAPKEGGGDSSVGRLKVAAVSSSGFVLTGTAKPNTEVTVKAGGNILKTTSDANGHYLVPVELVNIAVNSLVSIETDVDGKTSKILAKVEKDTLPAPTFSLGGKNIAQIKDFTAADLIDYLASLNPEWVRKTAISTLNSLIGTEYKDTIIVKLEINGGKGTRIIVQGHATPGSTVILAYKSVIYSSVVIADKNGDFTSELPKDLTAELNKNKDLKEIQHELISFAVDYKTNKISPFTKGLFKLFPNNYLSKPVL